MSSPPRFLLLGLLVLASCATVAEKKGMADVRKAARGVVVDLRYATAENITGSPLYPADMPCLLRASTAVKLAKAHAALRAQGCGLKVWDAWRPLEAHRRLYAAKAKTNLFQNPAHGWSRHCGGIAVDVTLVDRKGRELPMPSGFDETLAASTLQQRLSDPVIQQNLRLLNNAMTAAGFKALPDEWWHFDDLDFLYEPIPVVLSKDIGVKVLP